MAQSTVEVGDIFRLYGAAYRQQYRLRPAVLKVMSALENCRTDALGGHVDVCEACGYVRNAYNSCRNRHCPKCQGLAREKWLLARQRELLPVVYFHVVFTIPAVLNRLALVNQQVIYDILFKAAAETLLELGADPRHLGGEIGFLAILHTWGQNLLDHPHLHCIVPGGGLSKDGQCWRLPRKANKRKAFFIHVNVLSALFKPKFLAYLKQAYQAGELKFVGEIQALGAAAAFQDLLDQLYGQSWVTYCKRPFGGPKQVLAYLGRYTHRVAISNSRLLEAEPGQVSFKWRDYRDGHQEKVMTLAAVEFIRRFLLHVLPTDFCKIRYYGFLSTRKKAQKLQRCRELLGVKGHQESAYFEITTWQELLLALTGIDVRVCPACGKGRMVCHSIIKPTGHGPP